VTQTVARPHPSKAQSRTVPSRTVPSKSVHDLLVARQEEMYTAWRREEALLTAVRGNLDEGGDDVDRAMMRAELDEQAMLSESLRSQLDDLTVAIQRSEAGTYGVCERCGDAIPDERLSLFPATTHCVACKTWMERH
jgi:DnaK suppressor protein